MLNKEQKQQIFIKLRQENYQASLRLEGFQIAPANAAASVKTPPPKLTLAEIKAKYAR
jgi:Protein of unknown function (DUF2559)